MIFFLRKWFLFKIITISFRNHLQGLFLDILKFDVDSLQSLRVVGLCPHGIVIDVGLNCVCTYLLLKLLPDLRWLTPVTVVGGLKFTSKHGGIVSFGLQHFFSLWVHFWGKCVKSQSAMDSYKDCLIIIWICCLFLLSFFMPLILSQGKFEGIFE